MYICTTVSLHHSDSVSLIHSILVSIILSAVSSLALSTMPVQSGSLARLQGAYCRHSYADIPMLPTKMTCPIKLGLNESR